jgi:hypothetical protein
MKASHFATIAIAGVLALGLGGCKKTATESAADTTAQAIVSASNAAAESMDTQANMMTNSASEAVMHEKAEAVRDAGKHKAAEVKDAADTSK